MNKVVPVVIADYSNEWPIFFKAEYTRLISIFPRCIIEHIGSTAVPGLAAKPIIDIMLGASSLTEIEDCIQQLALLGYEYFPHHERILPHRRFFSKAASDFPACHIHGVVKDTPFWLNHLAFRNALRANAELVAQYAQLKQRLATEFREDRAAYTDAKAPFIQSVLATML